jgi:hypothetical protein
VTLSQQHILRVATLICIGVGVVGGVGCRPGPPRRPLLDGDPIFLIPAIKKTAKEDHAAEVPRLIELLESEDSAVRLYAIGALRDLTGQNMGYVFYAPLLQRQEGVDRWRRWAVENGLLPSSALPASRPAE